MTTLVDFFSQAQLALAAYADLSSGGIDDLSKDALKGAGMSAAQVDRFASSWRVVTQYHHSEQIPTFDDAGNLTGYVTSRNGLSVTVFEEVETGKGREKVSGTFSGRFRPSLD